MLRCFFARLILAACVAGMASHAAAASQARHFILVVWDGMRPDFVTPELTPTLCELRSNGVWFSNHHSVYPTSTEVNGTVLATGVFPRRSGIVANREYRPEIHPLQEFGTAWLAAIRRGDALSGGKYVGVPTVAELVQARGFHTAVSGTKGVALLHDRRARGDDAVSRVCFAGDCLPASLLPRLTSRLGAFPAAASPNAGRDTWTTRCLTEVFWQNAMPRYSVLWLSEPDLSQHNFGPGSTNALEAIRSCDRQLAVLLRELERREIRAQTDVIVVSDHGFSTIGENVDAAAPLRSAGLNAQTNLDRVPVSGDITVVGNGGSVLVYVAGRVPRVIRQAVEVLQRQPFTGVIFTRDAVPGTFSLAEVMMDAPTAPDIVVATRWVGTTSGVHPSARVFNDGYPEFGPGDGMHVTLSPSDLNSLGVACGPDFRRGFVDSLPTGNVDIAPTLLWLLGIEPPQKLDGRVLSEALAGSTAAPGEVQSGRRDARVELPGGVWEQYLRFTEFGGVRYLEEGNGQWKAEAK